jgi:hypothetical protein
MSELDKTKCRICHRPAVANMDLDDGRLPVCERHHDYLNEALQAASALSPQDRFVGFGLPLEPINPDQPDNTSVRCDRSTNSNPHTWTGYAHAPCHWCLTSFVELLRDDRARVLSPLDTDPEDSSYQDAVLRRGQQLVHAMSNGLITRNEAQMVFERLVAHV